MIKSIDRRNNVEISMISNEISDQALKYTIIKIDMQYRKTGIDYRWKEILPTTSSGSL